MTHQDKGPGHTHFDGDDCKLSLDEILFDLANYYSTHKFELDGSDYQGIEVAKAEFQALIDAAEVEARLDELKHIPRTRSKQAYIENRIITLLAALSKRGQS